MKVVFQAKNLRKSCEKIDVKKEIEVLAKFGFFKCRLQLPLGKAEIPANKDFAKHEKKRTIKLTRIPAR